MSSQVLSTQAPAAVDAWVRLLRGHTAVRRTLSAQLQADHDLTISEYEALLVLSREEEGQMRRVDLAERLALTPSGITRLLDGLERAGCVTKAQCASDARVTYAVLTDAGRERVETASGSHVAQIHALFAERYSEEELATLVDLLGRLPGAGGASAEECRAGNA